MKIEDYDEVYSLWLSCVGMGLNNLDDSKEGIAKFLQRNPETCLVATKESSIVGVITTALILKYLNRKTRIYLSYSSTSELQKARYR